MLKQSILILSAALIFWACNNKKKEPTSTETEPQLAETKIKDDILKFPDSLLLKETLIQYYRENGAYDKALAITNEALQKDSGNARIWGIKATLQYENGDTMNAIPSFETAANLLPVPGYTVPLGSLYAQTKNKKALDIADILLEDKSTDLAKEALFIKGEYFSYTGDKKQAIAFFDKCLALDYTFMFAYREKAIALYSQNKYQDAVKVLEKAVTLQNNFDEGYYWLGQCFEKLNNNEAASESYRRALLYDPNYIEAKDALTKLEGK